MNYRAVDWRLSENLRPASTTRCLTDQRLDDMGLGVAAPRVSGGGDGPS